MDLLVSFVFAYYLDLASSIVSFLFVRIVDYFLYLYINKHTKKYFRELEILDDSLEIFFSCDGLCYFGGRPPQFSTLSLNILVLPDLYTYVFC